jgi:pSer/pThr/pTyr-binding forkhead associated (FHA) protein
MEKLVVFNEAGVTQEFPLDQRTTRLGRDRSNDICLSDKSVSRHHASVIKMLAQYFLQDEKSTNGTRLNGQEVRKHILKHGDEIEIGIYRLRFQDSAEDRALEDIDKTVVMTPKPLSSQQSQPPEATKTVLPPSTAPTAQDQARIRFLAGPSQGELQTLDRAFFSIGKPGGDLVLINRRHTGYFLLKMSGDMAPRVNGQTVRAGGVKLNNGDRIQLGELDLEFML